MFVWELVSARLRTDGWDLWHTSTTDNYGPTYFVHMQRLGYSLEVSGPTLTEAYATAAKRSREILGGFLKSPGTRLSRSAALTQV